MLCFSEIKQCASFAPYINLDAAAACKPSHGVLQEPWGNTEFVVVPALPGCNLLWGNTPTKPTCSPAVAGLDITGFTGTDGSLVAASSYSTSTYSLPTGTGWQNVTCFTNNGGTYPLDDVTTSYYDASQTVERCTASCLAGGYTYAAMEYRGGYVSLVFLPYLPFLRRSLAYSLGLRLVPITDLSMW